MILTVTANAAVDRRYVMEKINTGEVNRVREVSMSAGGKGLNVSRAAKIAGEDVVATGFLGGFHGKFIQSELGKEGIGDGFFFCDGETRSCINIWNEELKQQTELLEPGLSVTEKDEEALVENFENLIKKADVAAISEIFRRVQARRFTENSYMQVGTQEKGLFSIQAGKLLLNQLSISRT